MKSKCGSIQAVLVDEITHEHVIARSRGDAPEIDGLVIIENAPAHLKVGQFVDVTITGSDDYDLFAEV